MLAPKQTVPKPQLTNFLSFDAPVEQILQEAPKVGREEKSQSKPEPLGCNRIFQQYSVIFNPINPINPIPVSVQPSSWLFLLENERMSLADANRFCVTSVRKPKESRSNAEEMMARWGSNGRHVQFFTSCGCVNIPFTTISTVSTVSIRYPLTSLPSHTWWGCISERCMAFAQQKAEEKGHKVLQVPPQVQSLWMTWFLWFFYSSPSLKHFVGKPLDKWMNFALFDDFVCYVPSTSSGKLQKAMRTKRENLFFEKVVGSLQDQQSKCCGSCSILILFPWHSTVLWPKVEQVPPPPPDEPPAPPQARCADASAFHLQFGCQSSLWSIPLCIESIWITTKLGVQTIEQYPLLQSPWTLAVAEWKKTTLKDVESEIKRNIEMRKR